MNAVRALCVAYAYETTTPFSKKLLRNARKPFSSLSFARPVQSGASVSALPLVLCGDASYLQRESRRATRN